MHLERLLRTDIGINVISVILGLGLVAMINNVFTNRDRIKFSAPVLSEFDNIYKSTNGTSSCVKYDLEQTPCLTTKQNIEISNSLQPLESFMNYSSSVSKIIN